MNQLLEKLCALLGAFALAFTMSGLITSYLGQIVFVKGSSMEHTLKNRDILLVRKWGKYRRGEVVICHYPKRVERAIHIGAALTLSRDTVFVKRLVALPGDSVEILEGTLYVNDEAVADPPLMASAPRDYARRRLGRNQYFVVGDNRFFSHDSRAMNVGPLPENMLMGHVRAVLWPLRRIQKVK